MASGTINGSFSGPSSTDHARPQITWSSTTSVSGNYSNVTATLRFRKWQHWNSWNANGHNVTLTINGNSDSANRVFDLRNSNNYVVWSRTVKVNHGSDGSKTIKIGASGNTGVSLGSYNFSGDADLGTIPRASTLSAFSFNADLRNGRANQINYTVDRKSDSFRHQIQLRDGSTTVRTWDNISSNGDSTLTLTDSEVKTLLSRMSSVTSKSYTLRVATRSGDGGSWIGSAVSRTATATVDDDVKPNASGMSVSISGNGHDSSIGKYVQGITRVYGSFSGTAGYGASVSSNSFVVRRVSGSADSQTVNSSSGTTGNAVALSGPYEAIGTTTDSRGRTDTSRTTFTVDAYSAPVITTFTATRNSNTPATVNIVRAGRHSPLNGSNVLTIRVQKKRGSGSWDNVVTDVTTTGSSFSEPVNSTGNNSSLSYDFRVYIWDQFGRDAEVVTTVSTQRVVLDIHKNEGVGIGKIHERGVLDVDGSAYFKGNLHVNDVNISNAQLLSRYVTASGLTPDDSINFWQSLPQGKYFIQPNDFPNQPENYGVIDHTTHGGDFNTVFYTQSRGAIYRKSGNGNNNYAWRPIDRPLTGSNSYGNWIRFEDGTQLAWRRVGVYRTESSHMLDSPTEFINENEVFVSVSSYGDTFVNLNDANLLSAGLIDGNIRVYKTNSGTIMGSGWLAIIIFMAGRWK